ncbi:hypothetical protein SGFS_001900 [Streptomyces graminofaciens]|uniref:Interferon-induced transmembrane protein n=1 Tax=Streptomyces graminofaciens TaxID=68212 RepID=A0ABN5V7I8_9ACTN|nr:CD225/dispanin family protein [Streptomyces graminofaciens]BBC28899.1 hypothetical protein SGFS_001900 [Streptomyces graminofaciens]
MADKHHEPQSDDIWGPDPLGQQPFPPSSGQPGWSQETGQGSWGPQHTPQRPAPESYMTPAILVTILCFLPTGIAAIVFASQVSAKNAAGDYEGAVQASRKARILVFVSLGIGVLFWLIMVIVAGASDSSAKGMLVP